MEDRTKRFALSALAGFFTAVVILPVSCGGFVLYNEHLYGDVETGGPDAILKAMVVATLAAILVGCWTWARTRPR